MCWGEALLAADAERVGALAALGLDEFLFGRQSRRRTQNDTLATEAAETIPCIGRGGR